MILRVKRNEVVVLAHLLVASYKQTYEKLANTPITRGYLQDLKNLFEKLMNIVSLPTELLEKLQDLWIEISYMEDDNNG